MSKALSSLSWLTTVGIFLFVGILYLTVFASQQKTWAQSINELLSHCQGVGNPPSPSDVWNSTDSVTECQNQCNIIYSMCQVRNLCNPISICSQLGDICRQGCTPAPPPPPTCSSFGGNCYHRLSCAPSYYSLPGGDAYCEDRFGPVYSCCRPLNACERARGTCVNASSQGVAPCPAGKHYDTSLSCNSLYQVCCAPNQPQPPIPPPPPPPSAQTYTISGNVFIDLDRDQTKDASEVFYTQGAQVRLIRTGYTTRLDTTDGSGRYSFTNRPSGTYTVRLTVPARYRSTTSPYSTTTVSRSVSVPPSRTNINFGIARAYTISGWVFEDFNGNKRKDVGEDYTKGGITITSNGGTVPPPNQATGAYTVTSLFAGTYVISLLPPAGYSVTIPNPPQFQVTVGTPCSVTNSNQTGASCDVGINAGNIINLNFPVRTADPWMQTYGFDVRFDSGYTNLIPANPAYPPYAAVEDKH